jgi:hypothetical protein
MSPWTEEQEHEKEWYGVHPQEKGEKQGWDADQQWEKEWHGSCCNSFWEETKQLVYARKMGLKFTPTYNSPYTIDLKNASVMDIGGGAYSLLLKCINFSYAVVVDPCDYPDWIYERYKAANIDHVVSPGEILSVGDVTECWIYNCLQHTKDPEKIIQNALGAGRIVRLFEWIDTPVTKGHPQTLTEEKLNDWLGGVGKVEQLNESGCVGKAYYGVFKGKHYDE